LPACQVADHGTRKALYKEYISNFLYGTIKFSELKNDMAFIQGALTPDVKIWQKISITD